MAMNWDDIGNAITDAVRIASGLDENHVIWKHQNYNAPDEDYLTISLGNPITLGIDYIVTTTDMNRPRGREVEIKVEGVRERTLEIEFFSLPSETGGAGNKEAALAKLEELKTSLTLPTIRNILRAQRVSPFDPGPTNWIPDIPGSKFRGRASCSIRCYMPPPTVAEYVGFIDRVTGQIITTDDLSGEGTYDFDSAVVRPGDEE